MDNLTHFRNLINLFEARNPGIEYHDETDGKKVIAKLYSYNSQSYTKLAQKLQKIDNLEAEIKAIKLEVQGEAKENINDLFDAEDAVRTRVVETISFIFTLTKDPKETVSPKYKDILAELETHLTPELIVVLEKLKKQMVNVTQKSPGLSVKSLKESVSNIFNKIKNAIFNWGTKYDQKLNALKIAASTIQ